jgi:hypothetical protein
LRAGEWRDAHRALNEKKPITPRGVGFFFFDALKASSCGVLAGGLAQSGNEGQEAVLSKIVSSFVRKTVSMLRLASLRLKLRLAWAAEKAEGSIAVEFALIVPVLLVVLGGITDVSRLLYYQSEVTQAVRSGTQFATANVTNYTGVASVVTASTALGGQSGFAVSSNMCACSSTAAATLTFSACSSLTCASPQREYLQISASYSWHPIFGIITLLPSTASNTIDLRVQ